LASNLYRANQSIGNKINAIDNDLSSERKSTSAPHLFPGDIQAEHLATDSVTTDALATDSVTSVQLARGSVGTESLGIVNKLTSDGNLVLSAGGTGHLMLDGTQYTSPYDSINPNQLYTLGVQASSNKVMIYPYPPNSGYVPVIPTSAAVVSGGSATTSTNGVVSFTGTTGIRLNGVFSAAYSEYVVKFYATSSAGSYCYWKFSSGGTDNSTSAYAYTLLAFGPSDGGLTKQGGAFSLTSVALVYASSGTQGGATTVNVHRPYQTSTVKTLDYINAYGIGTTQWGAGGLDVAGTAFDGFSIIASSGTITGSVQVLGVRS
jgi:hypothetical protein